MSEAIALPLRTQTYLKAQIRLLPVLPDQAPVIIKRVRGLDLINRKDLIKYFDSQHKLDQLVNDGILYPYHANGQAKQKVNGRFPGGSSYYDFNEWLEKGHLAG